jgi:hypothetical protein
MPAVTLYTCVWEVLPSNFGWVTVYSENFSGLSQSLWGRCQDVSSIRSRPFPFKPFPNRHSFIIQSFYDILTSSMKWLTKYSTLLLLGIRYSLLMLIVLLRLRRVNTGSFINVSESSCLHFQCQSENCGLVFVYVQGVPGGEVNILRGHSIGHSEQKSVYVHVSYSKRFPR